MPLLPRRRSLVCALPLLGSVLAGRRAVAQTYPDRTITVIAPFSAGGTADLAARILATYAPRHLPSPAQPVVVENRTGASGAVGTQYVQRARPDGQTLLLARVGSSAILPAIDPRTPYAWDDFTMLGLLDENPYVLVVRADAPWQRLDQLLAALREQPGRLNFSTSGPATVLDLGMRHLFATAGLPIDAGVAVPFRGGGEALTAVLGGQAQFLGNNLSEMTGALAAGQLRALVVSTRDRLPSLPDVPTAQEADVPALEQIVGWDALFGPPGLPEPVKDAWTVALAALAQDPEWVGATRRVGAVPRILTPVATRDYVRQQVALYRDLARRLGLG